MVRTRDLLSRFHQLLVEKIRRAAPEYLLGEFTVAEIYQTLVPYADHRDRLGIEVSGDYELALLRLLAGEGDFLQLQADAARQRLRRELETSSPNLGLYREYAALGVRLNPAFLEAAESGVVPPPGPPAVAGSSSGTRPRDPGAHRVATVSPPSPDVSAPPPPSPPPSPPPVPRGERAGGSPASAAVQDCPSCHKDLPDRSSLRFCPHCGVNVRERACPSCKEALDWSWGFCIACGHRVRES